MTSLCISPLERARKTYSQVLRSMEEPGTAKNIAQILGVAESTVSRTKDTLENAIGLLYQLGFKVVSNDKVCVDRPTYEAMAHIAQRAMSDEQTAKRLIWDEEQ